MKRTAVLFAALSFIAGSAVAENYAAGSIEIGNPWMRATPRGADVASAYMTIVNKGTEADRLIGGSLTGVSRFELHRMVVEEGVAKMRPIAGGLEIKAGQSVALAPGSFHVMLIGLNHPFQQGQRVKGTLIFEKAGKVEIEFTVESIGASTRGQSTPVEKAGPHSGH